MSTVFTKYMDEKNQLTRSYYDHHKLRPRTIKTKENIRGTVQSNPMTNDAANNNVKVKKLPNMFLNTDRTSSKKQERNDSSKNINLGRNLFIKEISINKELGPGQYSPTINKSQSFGYIQKQSDQKQITSKKFKDRKAQLIGPGTYNVEKSNSLLSTSRNFNGMKFGSEKLIRYIISKQKSEKINLQQNQQQNEKQVWKRKLGPGCYNIQKSQQKNANFTKTLCYPISMTQRSSLIRNDKLPGPGHYDWQSFMDKKNIQKYKRPKVQFKFVHGFI